MTTFKAQAAANVGITWADPDAKLALFKAIVENKSASPLGKRVVMWLIETASGGLSTPVEVSFYHEIWGCDLANEIQHDAGILTGRDMRQLWLDCGVGRHLTHHTGGRDNLQKWNARVRATTLWIVEGEDHYNHKGKAMVVSPNLAEIGRYSLKQEG